MSDATSDLTLFTVSYNHLRARLPRLLYSIDKYIGNQYVEHIIWDNNSKDGTKGWLQSLNRPSTIAICSDRNINDLPAYNELAKMCKTKYFMVINPNVRITGPFDTQAVLQSFEADPKLILAGSAGPCIKFADMASGIAGDWEWVPRFLWERDLVQDGDIDTMHCQTHYFCASRENFLEVGGFEIRNRRFDMRWPEKRFDKKPVDLLNKGNMISGEVGLSVRARRLGYHIAYISMPAQHYFSAGQTVRVLDDEDMERGLSPLGYQAGMYGEDKFLKNKPIKELI